MFQERWGFGVMALAVLLLLPAGALAQNQPDSGGATTEKELDAEARTAYRLGEFDSAIKSWKEAYRVSSHAVYLYNIAQAYRRKQDFRQSIFFYKQYLNESPNAPNRADVEAHIAEMKKNLEEAAATKEAPPEEPLTTGQTTGTTTTGTTTTGTTTGTTPVPRDDTGTSPGRGLRYAGIGAGIAGVALIGTSLVFALKASSAESDVEAARENAEPWSEELQDRFEAGESAATTSKLTLAVGGAALITGGVLFYLGHRAGSEAEAGTAARFVPTVSPDGVAASFELSF